MVTYNRVWSDRLLKEGNKYIVTRRPTGVASGSSSALVIENTSSDVPIFVESLTFKNNQGKGYIDATKNLTISANGTSVDVNDMRVDGTNEVSAVSAEHSGSYSGGTTFSLDLTEGSTSPSTAGRFSVSTASAAFMIAPGEAMRFTVQNQSGSASDQLLRAILAQPDEL